MVSTHISSSGIIWQLGDKEDIIFSNCNTIIEHDSLIVQMSEQMTTTTLKTDTTPFISDLIYFLKYIFSY
jgi:hypothetical protein